MKHEIVAIHDRAVDAYLRPWFVPALGQAVRAFGDEINRPAADNTMNQHPEDYDLYHLGSWDDQTGEFTNIGMPKQIAIGKNSKI